MNYTDKEIKNIIDKSMRLNEDFIIEPIGNHNIGRHLVYKVITKDKNYIFKIYYIKGKSEREINSLNILRDSSIRIPKVMKYGDYDNHEWVLMEYIDGEIFENILASVDENNKLFLFRELGEALGKIHSYKTFNYALGWDRKIKTNDFKKYKIEKFEKRIDEIKNQNLLEKEMLFKAIDIIRENYDEIFKANDFRLTHNDFDGRNILVSKENGIYTLKAVIDFEQSYPDNCENDLANLYFKYFIENKDYEKSFINGYSIYMKVDENFYKHLKIYLMLMIIEHCSWSYEKAKDYYIENIEFLKKIL